MKTLKDFNFNQKRVLVRCDFNVPLGKQGEIVDDFRIKKTIPTIEYLTKKGAKIILMTHIGRPGGETIEELRTTPVQNRLIVYLDLSITKAPDCIGSEVEKWTYEMQPGEILLLENLKFHIGEEENDDNFARNLSKLGEIYINDAFGTCHQPYASIIGVPKYLPSGIGFLVEKEIQALRDLIEKPEKPLVGIIGGKKVETKSKAMDRISENADWILINELIKQELKEKNIQLKNPQKIIEPIDNIEGKDIGPKTISLFKEKIKKAETIFWAGPLGKIEEEKFQNGSREIAQAIIESGTVSFAGGGETVEFLNKIGVTEKFSHVSTGGGAMLDFIADGKLVGLEAIK